MSSELKKILAAIATTGTIVGSGAYALLQNPEEECYRVFEWQGEQVCVSEVEYNAIVQNFSEEEVEEVLTTPPVPSDLPPVINF